MGPAIKGMASCIADVHSPLTIAQECDDKNCDDNKDSPPTHSPAARCGYGAITFFILKSPYKKRFVTIPARADHNEPKFEIFRNLPFSGS